MADLLWRDASAGRNGIDPPLIVLEGQCCEALNVEFSEAPLGEKRNGASNVSLAGGALLINSVRSMFRHVPGEDETAAEFWAVDSIGQVKRLAGGTTWTNVTLVDAISSNFQHVEFCSFNGKLFIAYSSGVDRLHVWDPTLSLVRRVGLAASAAPSVANTGAGAYAAELRYYRTRTIHIDSGKIIRRSEPSPSTSFTPSGAGTAARVTRAAAPGENETHWEVEASPDNETFYVIAGFEEGTHIAIGTTTYDDSASVGSYANHPLSEQIGTFTLPGSCKYFSTDSNRLLMLSSWQDVALSSHVYFTPVLGDADHGDDERIVSTNTSKGYIALNRRNGGGITGAANSDVGGIIYVFKYRRAYRLVPTGVATAPYTQKQVSGTIGAIHSKTIAMGTDSTGNTIVGFLSHAGPQRIDGSGVTYCGRDMEDLWYAKNGREGVGKVNLSASIIPAHGLWHSDRRQFYWFVATGSHNSPNERIRLDIRRNVIGDPKFGLRGGWVRDTGKGCRAVCSAMFSKTIGASMSLDLLPYIGYLDA